MTLPVDLVLVRHGKSLGNLATELSKQGDNSLFTAEFRAQHSSLWPLTEIGVVQATQAGIWLANNGLADFHRYYVSEYTRAAQTAAYLDLPNARWYLEFYLRERDWGDVDTITYEERSALYADSFAKRKADPFHWSPPNGSSIADLCLRADRFLDTLHRECSEKKVIIVTHGELMWAFRTRIERLTHKEFIELDNSKNPHDYIHNCQIIQYSRRDPLTGELSNYVEWMRSVCPWDTSRSSNEWTTIPRRAYTNEQLLEFANL